MLKHHELAIEAGVARFAGDPGVLAVVLIGSLARGSERSDSDVDLLLVNEDGHAGPCALWESVDGLYKAAAFDVKMLSLARLRHAPERAGEAMRWCLAGARVLWAASPERGSEITNLIARTSQVSEGHWRSLQASFIARAAIGAHIVGEGEALGNTLMVHLGATDFVSAISRAILALNTIVYGGPKYLEAALGRCVVSLPDLATRLPAFLSAPTAVEAKALFADLFALAEWPIAPDEIVSRYVEDHEFAWATGVMPPEYR